MSDHDENYYTPLTPVETEYTTQKEGYTVSYNAFQTYKAYLQEQKDKLKEKYDKAIEEKLTSAQPVILGSPPSYTISTDNTSDFTFHDDDNYPDNYNNYTIAPNSWTATWEPSSEFISSEDLTLSPDPWQSPQESEDLPLEMLDREEELMDVFEILKKKALANPVFADALERLAKEGHEDLL